MPATIASPVSGCRPSSRGSASSRNAVHQIDIEGLDRARQSHPLGLRLAVAVAELDVVPIGALFEGDRQPACRVGSKSGLRGGRICVGLQRERPVCGGNSGNWKQPMKAPKFAEFEAQPASAANRAEARIRPRAVIGEKSAARAPRRELSAPA